MHVTKFLRVFLTWDNVKSCIQHVHCMDLIHLVITFKMPIMTDQARTLIFTHKPRRYENYADSIGS